MQPHTIKYFKYFDISPGEYVYCEICGCPSGSTHHLSGRWEGKEEKENLMAICIKHHEMCHASVECNILAQEIHNKFIECNPYNNPEMFDERIFKNNVIKFEKEYENFKKH
jgi:hypothetical protein